MPGNVLDRFRLDAKAALVTGGSRGLGYVIAEALSSAGAVVALSSRSEETAKQAAEQIAGATGRKVVGIAADVVNVSPWRRWSSASWGRLAASTSWSTTPASMSALLNDPAAGAQMEAAVPLPRLTTRDWICGQSDSRRNEASK